ncbi:MAG: carbon-nitrogen hydrolase family protein [Ignisphaera sp.]|uniref:Carbon-nitrogen hydrolase family protein n=1 Tax=Ignisphaera aggregans TaxID=334771 RepID=A0A7C4NM30_9CREN
MQKDSGITIAVAHGVIELGKFEQNIRKFEEVFKRAHDEGVEVLLLPAMINGIPVFDLRRSLRVKKTAETIPGKTSEQLAMLSNKYGLYLVVGPILERRGSKLYRSAFIVEPTTNLKAVMSQILPPLGYGQGSSISIATVKNTNIGVFIAEDIHLPELSLLMRIIGVNVVAFYPYPYISADKVMSILKTRALELRTIVICVGCMIKRKDEEIVFMPTAIVDENGVVIHEVLDKTIKMIKIVIPTNHKRDTLTLNGANRKILKILNKTLSYYIRG